jgi:hypothetical protein
VLVECNARQSGMMSASQSFPNIAANTASSGSWS